MRTEVTDRLAPEARNAGNRYFADSPIYPGKFAQDWNRSYIMEPDGHARRRGGAAARPDRFAVQPAPHRAAVSRRRLRRGRDPAAGARHGAGGLTEVEWEDWTAATRLAVREARSVAGPGTPLHIVGFSNGGALAMKYALDALERPDAGRGRTASC